MSDWKQALYTLLEGHPSDSDIEDFVADHPDIDGKLMISHRTLVTLVVS